MLVLLAVLAGAAVQAAPVEYYASKYDHIDVETILNNRRMVNYYAACLLSEGPCPPEGLEFKRILPEALRTKCERCTEKQKVVTLRTFRRLRKEYPKVWARLQAQWDPDDVFVRKFEETFDKKSSESVVAPLANRFAPEEKQPMEPSAETKRPSIVSTTVKASPPPSTTTSSPSTTTSLPSTTTTPSPPSTKPTSRSSSPCTNRPFIPTVYNPVKVSLPDFGANIGATVSFGTDLLEEIVKGIGEISTKAFETGVEIADAVLKNFSLQKTAEIRF